MKMIANTKQKIKSTSQTIAKRCHCLCLCCLIIISIICMMWIRKQLAIIMGRISTTGSASTSTSTLTFRNNNRTTSISTTITSNTSIDTRVSQEQFLKEFRDTLKISGNNHHHHHHFDQRQQENRPPPPVPRIVHVWSPYVVVPANKKDNPFYPFNQEQNVTWQSLYEAQKYFNNRRFDNNRTTPLIHVYCVVLWTDVHIVQNHHPPLCKDDGKYNHLLILNRSSYTEYPSLKPPIHYPFIQDIFTTTLNDLQIMIDNDDVDVDDDTSIVDWNFDYIIYTNSDISIIKYFYMMVVKVITTYHYDSFIVNRRTIPRRINTNQLLTSNDLSFIEEDVLEKYGMYHPGVDCFVISKDIITNVNLGKMFLGIPPWARVLKNILQHHLSYNFHIFESKGEYSWTYHLGDERSWEQRKQSNASGDGNTTDSGFEQREVSKLRAKNLIRQCIYRNKNKNILLSNGNYPAHIFRNTMNCAEICQNLTTAIKHASSLWESISSSSNEPTTTETIGTPLSSSPSDQEKKKKLLADILSSKVNDDSIIPAFILRNNLEMKKRFYQVTATTNIGSEILA